MRKFIVNCVIGCLSFLCSYIHSYLFNSKTIVINLGNKKNEKRKKDLMYSGG